AFGDLGSPSAPGRNDVICSRSIMRWWSCSAVRWAGVAAGEDCADNSAGAAQTTAVKKNPSAFMANSLIESGALRPWLELRPLSQNSRAAAECESPARQCLVGRRMRPSPEGTASPKRLLKYLFTLMFENLQERLQRTFKSLRGQATLTEENIQETLRELRLALLEADVNFKVVKQFIDQVQAKAVGQQVMSALSPGEQVIKIVRDELVEVLGKDTVRVKFASQPPTVVLMAGLQGSGKTTTSGKLAHWFKNGGHRPLLVSVDVYRPARSEEH